MRNASTLMGILMMTVALSTGCASQPGAPKSVAGAGTNATVMIDDTFVDYIDYGTLGAGTMAYKGKKYHFKLRGFDIGDLRSVKIKASGEVYYLDDPWDLVGTYVNAPGSAATGVKGKSSLWLKNDKGVYLRLDSQMENLALAVGGDAIVIKMHR